MELQELELMYHGAAASKKAGLIRVQFSCRNKYDQVRKEAAPIGQ